MGDFNKTLGGNGKGGINKIKFLSMRQKLVTHVKYNLSFRSVLTTQDIKSAISLDEILPLVFQAEGYQAKNISITQAGYEATIKDIISEETLYLRQLHLISKVFRDFILMKSKALKIDFEDRLDLIFSNINSIISLTIQLIIAMEDLLEVKNEDSRPYAGNLFWEFAETMMFDEYVKFAEDVLSEKFKRLFGELIVRQDISNEVKYYLPMLLQEPIYHFFHYHKYVKNIMHSSSSDDEKRSLAQVLGMLNDPLYKVITIVMQMPGYFGSIKRTPVDIFHHHLEQRTNIKRGNGEESSEENEGSITNLPPEFPLELLTSHVYEGPLMMLDGILKQRYVFLFQNMIIVTKPHRSINGEISAHYSYKESYFLHKVQIKDLEDSDVKVYSDKSSSKSDITSSLSSRSNIDGDLFVGRVTESPSECLNYAFEIEYFVKDKRTQVTFKADSLDEKNAWMAALVMLKSKPTLEAALDAILIKEKNNNPLKMPSPDKYIFSEPDSPDNIIIENKVTHDNTRRGSIAEDLAKDSTFNKTSERIKGATIIKLVERLTHPLYSTPMMIKDFLMTYRSFSSPNELLDLLIQRFNIPDPEWYEDSGEYEELDETTRLQLEIDKKRFRNEFVKPVQTIILNVLKHWVSHYFYDFENDHQLFKKFNDFLEDIESTPLKGKWTDIIRKHIQRKQGHAFRKNHVVFTFSEAEPEFLIHLELQAKPEWPELLTYHPTEIARQLTLLDFEFFRSVKPSELVDCAWMDEKKKYDKSPTVMQVTRHFNNLTRYFEKILVDTENLEERQALMNRILEIMSTFQKLNNFNGMFAIAAATQSASIFRLYKTKEGIRRDLFHELQKVIELRERHDAKYIDRLHEINPPVVPHLGTYLDRVFKFEIGNPNFISREPSKSQDELKLINFYKSTKIAEQISELQQYQHEQYNFKTYPSLRKFLENIDPFPNSSEKERDDYLFEKSKEIEPGRDVEPKDAEKKWPSLQLISPTYALYKKKGPRRSANHTDASPSLETPGFRTVPSSPFSSNQLSQSINSNSVHLSADSVLSMNKVPNTSSPMYESIEKSDESRFILPPLPPKPRPPLPPKHDLPPIPPRRPPR